jgi:hypothetical protein
MPSPGLMAELRARRLDYPSLEEALRARPKETIECLAGADHPEWFTPEVLCALDGSFPAAPRQMFRIFHRSGAMELFRKRVPDSPQFAILEMLEMARQHPELFDPRLADLLQRNLAGEPARGFQVLQLLAAKRPELIRAEMIETARSWLARGVAQHLFGFLREAARRRDDLTPLCTLLLFECVLAEANLYKKREMIEEITQIAVLSHVKTGLERALREPLRSGTKAARALMAILFRQKLRAKQKVLLEALKAATHHVATWSFLVFLLESTEARQVSTAGAENFLERSYRLSLVSPDEDLVDYLRVPSKLETAFPEDVSFLARDAELLALYRRTRLLAEKTGGTLALKPLEEFRARVAEAEKELAELNRRGGASLEARAANLRTRLEGWRRGVNSSVERRQLAKRMRDSLQSEAARLTLDMIESSTDRAYRAAARAALGREIDLSTLDAAILPAFLFLGRLEDGSDRRYLLRLLEDRLSGRPHDWLRTEPPAAAWAEAVKPARADLWRTAFSRRYTHSKSAAAEERERRIDEDLRQTRDLFVRAGIDVEPDYEALTAALSRIETGGPAAEIRTNLERIRIARETPASDYQGEIELSVETDPFQYLFMGEYGFASCLSIRGANFWSAVSNAIDIDKAVVWARDPAGNIVGRRLIVLTPAGVVSYRTYTNRHGMALDTFFDDYIAACAARCNTVVAPPQKCGPLLSERWYDDQAVGAG